MVHRTGHTAALLSQFCIASDFERKTTVSLWQDTCGKKTVAPRHHDIITSFEHVAEFSGVERVQGQIVYSFYPQHLGLSHAHVQTSLLLSLRLRTQIRPIRQQYQFAEMHKAVTKARTNEQSHLYPRHGSELCFAFTVMQFYAYRVIIVQQQLTA